jgi:hypothetical protein
MSDAGVNVDNYGPWGKKFYFNALVMFDPIYDAQIKQGKRPEDIPGVAPGTHVLFKAPKTVYDWIISQITNPMIGDITDLNSGIDIYITKEGSGLNTKYTPTLSPNGRQPIAPELLQTIENLYNPDEIFSKEFDEKIIDGLVDHIRKSAGMISTGVPGAVAGMAGYPSTTAPAFGGTPVPPMAAPVAPQTYKDPQGRDWVLVNNQWVPAPPVAPTYAPAPPTVPQSSAPQPPIPQAPIPPITATVPPVAPNPPMPTPASTSVPQTPIPSTPPLPVNQTAPQATPQAPAASMVPQAPTIPQAPQASPPTPPTAPSDDNSNKPQCFGRYNATSVQCVVCPMEIACGQATT